MNDLSDLQEAILGTLYDYFLEDPFIAFDTNSLVGEAVEHIGQDFEDKEIEYALRLLNEEFLVDYDPALNSRGTIMITPHGVGAYNTSHKTFLKTENWYDVLGYLQELDEDSPGSFWEGSSFRDDLDMDPIAVDRNIWYLKEKEYIDVSMVAGDPPYTGLQINREGRRALESQRQVFTEAVGSTNQTKSERYDVFISHASEDKDGYVRPLAEGLSDEGLSVWYDEFELELGDSLRNSIDLGLANSEYGIIVLSEAYFEKDWTQYELDGLVARDLGSGKVILPIWYQISKDEIMNNSPTLADRYALRTDGDDIGSAVEEIAETIG